MAKKCLLATEGFQYVELSDLTALDGCWKREYSQQILWRTMQYKRPSRNLIVLN